MKWSSPAWNGKVDNNYYLYCHCGNSRLAAKSPFNSNRQKWWQGKEKQCSTIDSRREVCWQVWILLEKQRNKHCPLPPTDGFFPSCQRASENVPFFCRGGERRSENQTAWPQGPDVFVWRRRRASVTANLICSYRTISATTQFTRHRPWSASQTFQPELKDGVNRFFIKLPKMVSCAAVLHGGDLKPSLVPERRVFACDGLLPWTWLISGRLTSLPECLGKNLAEAVAVYLAGPANTSCPQD